MTEHNIDAAQATPDLLRALLASSLPTAAASALTPGRSLIENVCCVVEDAKVYVHAF